MNDGLRRATSANPRRPGEAARGPDVPERFRAGVHPYRGDEADELRAFRLRTFGADSRQLDPARDAWLVDRNPAAVSSQSPHLWVCEREDRIVGQQAEIPVELQVGARRLRAAWAVDLMVEPRWRLRGVAPALIAAQLEPNTAVAGLTQAPAARQAYDRGGWVDVGVVPTYVQPLDLRRFADSVPTPAWSHRLAPAADPLAAAARGAASRLVRSTTTRLIPVDRFDERVDEVWRAAVRSYPVIACRDAATTAWRLDQRPDADRLRRFLLVHRRRTRGYLALRAEEQWGQPVLSVVDFLAPPRWVGPLLLLAADEGRRQASVALVCRMLCHRLDRVLRATGFLRRGVDVPSPLHLVVHETADRRSSHLLRSGSSWFLTNADSDLS